MNSMTGYAYAETIFEDAAVSVEIKSLNSRFLDLSVNMPPFLGRLETRIKELCTKRLQRGKVDVYIRIREKASSLVIDADIEAARSYTRAALDVARALGKTEADIPLSLILAQDGVLNCKNDYDMNKYWAYIEPVFLPAIDCFCGEREREGLRLKQDMLNQLVKIEESLAVFCRWMPEMEHSFRNAIIKRFNELLGDKADEQRIMTETAALLMKYTINEEVVRLQSHIDALKAALESSENQGRKIDFICQELNREINTIGSKNQIAYVGAAVIAAKDALENIREQSRNVE